MPYHFQPALFLPFSLQDRQLTKYYKDCHYTFIYIILFVFKKYKNKKHIHSFSRKSLLILKFYKTIKILEYFFNVGKSI